MRGITMKAVKIQVKRLRNNLRFKIINDVQKLAYVRGVFHFIEKR